MYRYGEEECCAVRDSGNQIKSNQVAEAKNGVPDLWRVASAAHSWGIKWTVNPRLADATPIQRPALGFPGKLPPGNPNNRVDVTALIRANPPTNALLAEDLVERGILTQKPPFLGRPGAAAQVTARVAGGGGDTTVVDWRNRYGWNWVTRIRDQDPCEHCWIYGATALVEAQVRVEHCVWCARSEGDYIEANKVTCGQCGDPTNVLNWVASNGQCDLDCVPWVDRDPGDRTSAYWNPPSGWMWRRFQRGAADL